MAVPVMFRPVRAFAASRREAAYSRISLPRVADISVIRAIMVGPFLGIRFESQATAENRLCLRAFEPTSDP
jgi:hypothetical protein